MAQSPGLQVHPVNQRLLVSLNPKQRDAVTLPAQARV